MNNLIRILTAVVIVMFPAGLFLMLSGDAMNNYLWTTNIFLGLQGAVTFIFLYGAAEKNSALIAALLILILSFGIELTGVKTGYPFGAYSYTETLSPALFGVPIAITVSWFTVTVNAFLVSRFLLFGSSRMLIITVSAVIILAIDLLLEPFASLVNGYWTWGTGKVPVQNYFSWLAAGFFFSYLLDRFVLWNRNVFLNINFITIPAVVLSVNIAQFTIVNLYFGYIIITLCGLAVLAASVLFGIKAGRNES